MAPRNKPSLILKRDSTFTEAIGKPATGKPNPFATIAQSLSAKLEAARPTESAEPIPPDGPPTSENDVPVPETVKSDETSAQPDPSPAPDLQHSGTTAPETGTPRKMERAGEAHALASLTITMRIETGLIERAETWAAALGLPVSAVIRKSLNRMKPQLVAELRTLKATDVQVNRAESVGYRLQTQVRLDADELADLEARLDPADFGVMGSLVNFYTRSRFTVFLDDLLTKAGY